MKNRIDEIRKAKGLTVRELADLVGTTREQINNLKSGKRRLTTIWMKRIGDALGVKPEALISDMPFLVSDNHHPVDLDNELFDESAEVVEQYVKENNLKLSMKEFSALVFQFYYMVLGERAKSGDYNKTKLIMRFIREGGNGSKPGGNGSS